MSGGYWLLHGILELLSVCVCVTKLQKQQQNDKTVNDDDGWYEISLRVSMIFQTDYIDCVLYIFFFLSE